jgi:hypothetical protein
VRFSEFGTTRIMASTRYLKNVAFFLRGYPTMDKTLTAFLKAKVANPTQPMGAKDTPFTGGVLKGFWHVHLIHGKVVLVYDYRNGALCLYDVVEHNDFESEVRQHNLANYIAAADLEPLVGDEDETETGLAPRDTKEIEELFYMMAVEERDIINAAIAGDPADLMEFVKLTITADEATFMAAMGGQQGLAQALQKVVKSLGY